MGGVCADAAVPPCAKRADGACAGWPRLRLGACGVAVVTQWRSVDHVQEAAQEWKVPREAIPPELLRETAAGGRFAPHRIQPGEQFGDLTAIEPVGQRANGAYIWICKCVCGGEALRSSSALNHATREGFRPCCHKCLVEQRGGLQVVRAEALREAYRKQFVDFRTLWLPRQTSALMTGVLSDLEAEFGPMPDRDEPKLPLDQAAGWPYQAMVRRRETAEAEDVDDDEVPEENADDLRERLLAAQLLDAVKSKKSKKLNAALDAATVVAKVERAAENKRLALLHAVEAEERAAAAKYNGLRSCRCVWCSQRIAWRPVSSEHRGLPACSTACATKYALWLRRMELRAQADARAREKPEERSRRQYVPPPPSSETVLSETATEPVIKEARSILGSRPYRVEERFEEFGLLTRDVIRRHRGQRDLLHLYKATSKELHHWVETGELPVRCRALSGGT